MLVIDPERAGYILFLSMLCGPPEASEAPMVLEQSRMLV